MVKVEIFYIILGLFLGFFIIYITTPAPKVILKYPTIENIQSTTYVDSNGNCYKYYAQEIACPTNNKNSLPLNNPQNLNPNINKYRENTLSNNNMNTTGVSNYPVSQNTTGISNYPVSQNTTGISNYPVSQNTTGISNYPISQNTTGISNYPISQNNIPRSTLDNYYTNQY
ncbi:hypothetical protein [Powai lake megavirus]|uniref:Uncharacterized protein n=1 Tax=Powai lake megavirus TaxID=1842663 RepID=A0A167RHW7_9VIRU|nr:hypothetical protein QJ849_gp541 [Powai lake megavirus]ANB50703.1 hypothetical protein [Powai lake megavirus]